MIPVRWVCRICQQIFELPDQQWTSETYTTEERQRWIDRVNVTHNHPQRREYNFVLLPYFPHLRLPLEEHRQKFQQQIRETLAQTDDLLLEVWETYACPTVTGGLYAGGLSTLEHVEIYLRYKGLLDDVGNPLPSKK